MFFYVTGDNMEALLCAYIQIKWYNLLTEMCGYNGIYLIDL